MKTINASSKRNNSAYIIPISKNDFNYMNNEREKNNSDIIYNESIINLQDELNYEFEIRLLKKKLEEIKKINDKLNYKLNKIKKEKKRKIKENKEKKKECMIISKVIDIYKNLYLFENSNLLTSSNETFNGLINSNINSIESKNNCFYSFTATKLFKNMLLSLMGLKYDFQNALLKEEFINGLNKIFDNDNEKKKNDLKNNETFIINNIKRLLKEEINLKVINNKYKNIFLENKKYLDYFSKLCKKLSAQNLDNLENFLKNTIIKAEAEFKQINQIKSIIMNNTKENIEDIYKKDDSDIININKVQNDYYNLERKHYRNKMNSESKMNINMNSVKKEKENNSNRNLYSKNKNKFSINNNFFRNKDEPFQKDIFNTYRYRDSRRKNNNNSLIKQSSNEKINLYDFYKQKGYDCNTRLFLNNNNKKIINEVNKDLIKNRKEIPHCIKSVKIQPFKCEKRNKKIKNSNKYIKI